MTQKLEVNLTIQIPSELVLISKVELQRLQQNELKGVYWTMKDIEKRINRSNDWIKERILYPSHFREMLDIETWWICLLSRSKRTALVFPSN